MAGSDAVARSLELVSRAERYGASLRMVGGVAIAYLCGTESRAGDLDFVAGPKDRRRGRGRRWPRRDSRPTASSTISTGTSASTSSLRTDCRSTSSWAGWTCATTLDLRDRLQLFSPTVPPADLALSKLQIVEFTEKDHADTRALLERTRDRRATRRDRPAAHRRGDVSDWGWHRTVSQNLERFSTRGRRRRRARERTARADQGAGRSRGAGPAGRGSAPASRGTGFPRKSLTAAPAGGA